MCVIRMRVLFDELECPLCKVQQNIVIFTSNPNAQYSDLIQKKDRMMWDGKCKAYFEDMNYESEVRRLWELKCTVCNTAFPTLQQLTNHVKGAHNLQYCKICLENQKVFFCEKVLYNPEELRLHNKNGDKERNIKPHPSCDYCKKVFFSEENLYYHCKDNHETCFICDRQNVRFQYFRDYKHLEGHFRSAHFLCTEMHCLSARFVAFSSQFELKAHMVSAHSQHMTKEQQQAARQIEVNFSVRREGSDRNRPSQPVSHPTRNTSETHNSITNGAINFNPDDFGDNKPLPLVTTTNSNSSSTTNNNSNSNSPLNLSQSISNEERAERNVALKNKILQYFDGDQQLLANTMKKAKSYLDGQLTAAQFHTEMTVLFGEKESGKAIYDEIILLFPTKSKKLQEEIINHRQRLSQTQTIFPSLAEVSPNPTPNVPERVSCPQGTNYKNVIGTANSKQIVSSAFPTLQSTNPNPEVKSKKDPPDSAPPNRSALPGAGRGKPQQNKPKPTPQQQQQQQKNNNKEKSIEQQIREMQPSFGGSLEPAEPKQPSTSNAPVSGQGNNRKGNKNKQVVMSWG